jgi:hypothetical protein
MARGFAFGAGAIYNAFYSPIFSSLKYEIDLFDPGLNLDNVDRSTAYDFGIISSPASHHFANFIEIFQHSLTKVIVCEKPAVVNTAEYKQVAELAGDASLYTVTPYRLSPAYKVLQLLINDSEIVIDSIELTYGNRSTWPVAHQSLTRDANCLYDLGPHFIDMLHVVEDTNFQISNHVTNFNNFFLELEATNGTSVLIRCSRDRALSNILHIKTNYGNLVVPITLNSCDVFADHRLERKVDFTNIALRSTGSAKLFKETIFSKKPNELFSDYAEFGKVLNIMEKCQ